MVDEACSVHIHCDTGRVHYEPTTGRFIQDIYKFQFACDQTPATKSIENETAIAVRCEK